MKRIDALACRLVDHQVDWLLYLLWWVMWYAPVSLSDRAPLALPQLLTLVLLIPSMPLLTMVCFGCMRTRNLRRPNFRYWGAAASIWFLAAVAEAVSISLLASVWRL